VGFQARFGNQEFALPIETMLGTVGVAPPANEVRTSLVPERFGGNMDSPEVKVGTTIYLGVNVEGAMFSIGDGHYRQGEGESCGTAVEGAMNSVILVELIKGHAPLWPRLESDDYWMVVGSSRPMEDAWRISQVEMIHWLGDILGLHYMDAYQLVTQVTLAPIANCVDTNYSVVTKIPKGILPKATAFEGMHARLRELAKSVK
jgi:acetamidase/formamidase